MKVILTLVLIGISQTSLAGPEEWSTQTLVCGQLQMGGNALSCVSKSSIEKDKLQIELLKLQIQELKDKANKKK